MSFRKLGLGLLLASCGLFAQTVSAGELIVNGGFEIDGIETSTPFGWNVAELGSSGSTVSTSANLSPISGYATPGAVSGSFYALLDNTGPSTQILYQTFTAPEFSSPIGEPPLMTLTMDLFVNPRGTGFLNVGSLDYTYGGASNPSLYGRIDLLKAGVDIFTTNPSDMTSSLSIAGFGSLETFEETGIVSYGKYELYIPTSGTYTLRFATVASQESIQMGIDNVSLVMTPVPEPETYVMLLAGLGLLGVAARCKKAA